MSRLKQPFAVFALLLGLTACGGDVQVDSEGGESRIRPAKFVVTEIPENARALNFPAIVRAARESQLTFEVGGRIVQVLVIEGQQVQTGDVIARLDDRTLANAADQARAEFENAEDEYQRAVRLMQQDAISQSVLEGRRTQRDVAQAALSSAEENLSDTTLLAPFSGVISRVYVENFQNTQPQAPIADLQSIEVEAVVNAPATLVAFSNQFTSRDVFVRLDVLPEVGLPAAINETSGQADPNTQTFEASFAFDAPDELVILPGMTATLEANFDFAEGSIAMPSGVVVPLAAIIGDGGQTFVWQVDTDAMTISRRDIVVGEDIGSEVIVIEGLQGGETLIAAGGSNLFEGMQVREWLPR